MRRLTKLTSGRVVKGHFTTKVARSSRRFLTTSTLTVLLVPINVKFLLVSTVEALARFKRQGKIPRQKGHRQHECRGGRKRTSNCCCCSIGPFRRVLGSGREIVDSVSIFGFYRIRGHLCWSSWEQTNVNELAAVNPAPVVWFSKNVFRRTLSRATHSAAAYGRRLGTVLARQAFTARGESSVV